MDYLWSPWRYQYVSQSAPDAGCIFCSMAAQHRDEENYIVYRAERNFLILNLYPYSTGHLMIAPYDHLPVLQELDADTVAEMMALAQRAMVVLEKKYNPHGYNVGFNQGRVAGAGYEGHIHLHVVPRWAGDTNYMPVLADTRVMPQSLEQSYEALKGAF